MKTASIHLAAALALAAARAAAQDGAAREPSSSSPSSSTAAREQAVTITGSSVGRGEAAPISVLSGDELERRRGTSLGETLSRLPGVSSTYFGPNANRPTIRGQDGERVRVLANGGASADASTLSFDHAVPIDPLVIERLEVLRGPSALLYGGSAIGGVVNTIDNRIPSAAPDHLHAATLLRAGGAALERGASALLEGGGGPGLAWHVDAFTRKQDDMRVPGFDVLVDEDSGATERRDRIVNSSSRSRGGAVGASRVWQGGHAGLSVDTFRTDYGSVAEEAVRIRMRRERVAFESQAALDTGPVAKLRVHAASTRYAHDELEGGAVGTQFRNRGHDARVEANHRPVAWAGGTLAGTWGLQAEQSRFSLGEEAFVPPSRTRQAALFALETWEPSKGAALSLGLRGERVDVDSSGDAPDAEEPRFGSGVQRRFAPKSASLGVQWQATPAWQLLANVSSTQRAPAAHELYANGVHAATGAFERGDPTQSLERARHVELGTQAKLDGARVKLNTFATRYANYIALVPTGEAFDQAGDEGPESFPVYAYLGVPARLSGVELEANWPMKLGASTVDLGLQWDVVRGTNRATGEPLPRLAPMRTIASLDWTYGPTLMRVEVHHAAKQTRVPAFDAATPAWTQTHLTVSHRVAVGGAGDALVYAKLGNITNELAFNAATLGTVRSRAPLPGRSLAAGLQWTW